MALSAVLSTFIGNYSRASRNDPKRECPPEAARPSIAQLAQFVSPFVELMSVTTCYDIIGNSTQVVVIESTSPLPVAFVAAQESRATSCVLWNSSAKKFEGVLSMVDYIDALLHCHRKSTESDSFSMLTVREWINRSGRSGGTNFVSAHLEDKIIDCATKMVHGNIQRLPVFSFRQASGTTSVVGIVKFSHFLSHLTRTVLADTKISEAKNSPYGGFASLLDVPICLLDLSPTQQQAVCVTLETRIFDALELFLSSNVETLAIVDTKRIVIDTLSRADVLRLESGGVFDVTKTLGEALQRVTNKIVVCSPCDTFQEVLQHFVASGFNEIFVVDEKDSLIGQIALAHIMAFLLRCSGIVP